jgi:hypothetical protein
VADTTDLKSPEQSTQPTILEVTSGCPPQPFVRRFAQQIANDPDLARLVKAWPTLPDPIRRAMLALVSSVAKAESE